MWSFTGPWGVGYADLAYLEPGALALPDKVEFDKHVVGRLFYPTSKNPTPVPGGWWPLAGHRRGVRWLPGFPYAWGVAKFLFFRTSGPVYTLFQYLASGLSYVLGRSHLVDMHPGAPLATPEGVEKHPVVVFSHGLGGHRAMYTLTASELASQGYIVLAVEHADGTASCCQLAGAGPTHRFYRGLGGEEGQVQKTRDRVVEMKTASRVLRALDAGEALPGLALTQGLDPRFLWGKLDFNCLAAMGHSYGGATVTALVAEDPSWAAAVALDPWWYALPPETAALSGWRTRVPLMMQPSHDWSVPNAWGQLACGGERQAAVLAAARASGGGALRLVTSGTSHNSYADALPLFGSQVGWLLEKLGLSARLDPLLGIFLSITASLAFLATHLPLSVAQREMQNWQPVKGGGGLARVRERDAADRGERGGLFSGRLPGKGLLDNISDWLLNFSLGARPSISSVAAEANGEQPEDVGSAVEAMETWLPSADPASGKHPHAPSRRTDAVDLGAALEAEDHQRRLMALGLAERCELLRRVGTTARYSPVVTADELPELQALVGDEHIFIIEWD